MYISYILYIREQSHWCPPPKTLRTRLVFPPCLIDLAHHPRAGLYIAGDCRWVHRDCPLADADRGGLRATWCMMMPRSTSSKRSKLSRELWRCSSAPKNRSLNRSGPSVVYSAHRLRLSIYMYMFCCIGYRPLSLPGLPWIWISMNIFMDIRPLYAVAPPN